MQIIRIITTTTTTKMVDKSPIKVAVVGDYAELCGLGLPLPLSLQLQCLNLKLSGALWSAKASASGFSVSLYWPTAAPDTPHWVPVKAKKVRKNRKRRCKQAPASATNNQASSSMPVSQSSSGQPLNKTVCLNKEHPSPDCDSPGSTENLHHSGSAQCSNDVGSSPTMSNDSPIVDLAACSDVQ